MTDLTADLGTVSTPIDNGDGTFTAKYTAVDTIGDATITVETDDGKSAYASITLLRVVSNVEELKGIKAKKIVWKKDGAKMARIPTIGFKQKKTFNRIGEPIVKTVKVDGPDSIPFYMDETEITVGQFKKFLKSTDYPSDSDVWGGVYKYSSTDKHPMIYVSWHDATAYAEWSGKRLATEKEWEFAARGGLVDKKFPWGDDESVAREYASFEGIGGKDQWDNSTAPVGSFRPNGYGLYDMAGNVWEWCQDWYDSDQEVRVLRGGSWYTYSVDLRVANSNNNNPQNQ